MREVSLTFTCHSSSWGDRDVIVSVRKVVTKAHLQKLKSSKWAKNIKSECEILPQNMYSHSSSRKKRFDQRLLNDLDP